MSGRGDGKRHGSMNRRDILKAMSVAPAALAPAWTTPAASPALASTESEGSYKPKIFSPHEWRTLGVLCDLILPADERTGSATHAGVPEFIDDWLSVAAPPSPWDYPGKWASTDKSMLRTELLGGLAWLDMEANRSFGRDFADCSTQDQKRLLDRIAYPETAAIEDANAVAAFNHIRDLVLSGFYSSALGVKDLQYQGNKALAEWVGCPEDALSRLDVNYSHWKHLKEQG